MRFGQRRDAGRAFPQRRQHLAARAVGQRGEHAIEIDVFILNHMVYYR